MVKILMTVSVDAAKKEEVSRLSKEKGFKISQEVNQLLDVIIKKYSEESHGIN